MQLRWTEDSVTDLKQIADYLFEKTPVHSERIVLDIFDAPQILLQFPFRGRLGRKEGTRELVLASLLTCWSTRFPAM